MQHHTHHRISFAPDNTIYFSLTQIKSSVFPVSYCAVLSVSSAVSINFIGRFLGGISSALNTSVCSGLCHTFQLVFWGKFIFVDYAVFSKKVPANHRLPFFWIVSSFQCLLSKSQKYADYPFYDFFMKNSKNRKKATIGVLFEIWLVGFMYQA